MSKEWEVTEEEITKFIYTRPVSYGDATVNDLEVDTVGLCAMAQKKLWGYMLNNVPLNCKGDNTKLLELNRSFDFTVPVQPKGPQERWDDKPGEPVLDNMPVQHCPECGGGGQYIYHNMGEQNELRNCESCKGKGYIYQDNSHEEVNPCPTCGGSLDIWEKGKVVKGNCDTCNGTGWADKTRVTRVGDNVINDCTCETCKGAGKCDKNSQVDSRKEPQKRDYAYVPFKDRCKLSYDVSLDKPVQPCPDCGGKGKLAYYKTQIRDKWESCPTCKGTGQKPKCPVCFDSKKVFDECTLEMVECPKCKEPQVENPYPSSTTDIQGYLEGKVNLNNSRIWQEGYEADRRSK